MNQNSENDSPAAPRWPYVFHSPLKPLRNKHGACANCQVLPPDGKVFRKCAACKSVLYCSKECQKAHWKAHRAWCKQVQDIDRAGQYQSLEGFGSEDPDGVDPCWPADIPKDQRDRILHEWLTLQRGNFRRAIMQLRCLLLQQQSRDLDLDNHALLWVLGYRTSIDGNPATRFYVRGVQAIRRQTQTDPTEEKDTNGPRARGSGHQRVQGIEPWMGNLENLDDDMYGFCKLCFVVGETRQLAILPLNHMTPFEKAMFAPRNDGKDWLYELRIGTMLGTIWSDDLDVNDPNQIVGVMRKKGKKWEWSKMEPVEMALAGMVLDKVVGPVPEVNLNLIFCTNP